MTAEQRIGIGRGRAHHGELLQGMFRVVGGGYARGLVTLPHPTLQSVARFAPDSSGDLQVTPADRTKAARGARLALDAWRRQESPTGGTLTISGAIPQRLGLGSSTADVVAAITAVADALNVRPGAEQVAALAVQAESASDATMFDEAVLFAHREGRVLERLPAAGLPPMRLVGMNVQPDGPGVDTTGMPPAAYDDVALRRFEELLERLRAAMHGSDLAAVGAVSSESALVNDRHLPKPHLSELLELVERIDAAGVQVAHSGTLMGVLLEPGQPRLDSQVTAIERFATERGMPCWMLDLRSRVTNSRRADADGRA